MRRKTYTHTHTHTHAHTGMETSDPLPPGTEGMKEGEEPPPPGMEEPTTGEGMYLDLMYYRNFTAMMLSNM